MGNHWVGSEGPSAAMDGAVGRGSTWTPTGWSLREALWGQQGTLPPPA